MSTAALVKELRAQPHKDIEGALSSLSRRKKTLPEFQLILQAPDHPSQPITAKTLKDIFIISAAECLSEISDLVKEANQIRKLRVLFVHLDIPARCLPQLFALADLRLAKNVLALSRTDIETPSRVMQAWAWDSHHDLVATAEVSGHDTMVVTNCALETFVVKFSDFAAFEDISDEEKRNFELDSDGSYIHWPGPDIHLGMDDFRYVCNETFRRKTDATKLAHNQNFGKAIAKLRKDGGFTQASVPGISERTMRDIESGSRPSMSTLEKLALAHKQSLNEYLESVSQLLGSV